MTKGRRSRIHWQLAIDAGLKRHVGRDEEVQTDLDDPDYPEVTGMTLGGGADADVGPVTLDAEAQAKLLAYLRGKVESDHLVEVAQFLNELRDDGAEAEGGEAEAEDLASSSITGGGITASYPKRGGAQDSRHRQSFDERFPELARVKNLGGSGVATPRPRVSGGASDGRMGKLFPELARVRIL